MTPFCDYLGVTVPSVDEDLIVRLRPFLDAAGFHVEWASGDKVVLRSPAQGTFVWQKRFGMWCVGVSGAACSDLRVKGQWLPFLAEIGATPHRVTRLDAAADVMTPAPDVVRRVRRLGVSGKVKLSRKSVRPPDVQVHLAPSELTGLETGSVYLGSKNAEVRLVVYDKREERYKATGRDVGDLTRYELRLKSGVGVTLRDVAEPASVFWHHMGRSVLKPPSGVPAWSPHAEGWVLDRADPPLPFARLIRRVEESAEVLALCKLADELGPTGRDALCRLILKRSTVSGLSRAPEPIARPLGASGSVAGVEPDLGDGLARPLTA